MYGVEVATGLQSGVVSNLFNFYLLIQFLKVIFTFNFNTRKTNFL